MKLTLITNHLNRLLAASPLAQERLEKLVDKSMAIVVVDWALAVHVACLDQALMVSLGSQDADITVEGDGQVLLSVAKQQWQHDTMVPHEGLRIMGDMHVAMHFQQLFASLPWDLEALLAQWVGDVPAYHGRVFLEKSTQKAASFASWALAQFCDYQAYECDDWVSQEEVDAFCQKVDALRCVVDKMEQKLDL